MLDALWVVAEAGFAGREAAPLGQVEALKEGVRGETMGSPTLFQ